MKKFSAVVFIFFAITACAATPQKINLTEKGLITVKMKLIDFDQHRIMNPIKVYFIKIDNIDNLKSKTIIVSDKKDTNGNIFINLEPGTYAVAAADRYIGTTLTRTVLEDETMKISVTELKAGESKEVTLRILDYSKTVFDKMSDNLKYYHKVLNPKMVDFFEFKIGKFEPAREPKKDKASPEDEQPIIQSY